MYKAVKDFFRSPPKITCIVRAPDIGIIEIDLTQNTIDDINSGANSYTGWEIICELKPS